MEYLYKKVDFFVNLLYNIFASHREKVIMKIKTKRVPYEYVEKLPPQPSEKLGRPSFFFRLLIRILSIFELRKTKFTYTKIYRVLYVCKFENPSVLGDSGELAKEG